MAKNKLQVAYDYNFTTIALNVSVKSYKLAWSINKDLNLNLSKCDNIAVSFKTGKNLSIINFVDQSEHRTVRLLKNRADENEDELVSFIVPELKSFDYFIILENESSTFDENTFLSKIKEIPFVLLATKVDTETLKSRDNLIF